MANRMCAEDPKSGKQREATVRAQRPTSGSEDPNSGKQREATVRVQRPKGGPEHPNNGNAGKQREAMGSNGKQRFGHSGQRAAQWTQLLSQTKNPIAKTAWGMKVLRISK